MLLKGRFPANPLRAKPLPFHVVVLVETMMDQQTKARTLLVSFVPPVADPKTIRFKGTTFEELKHRLVEAKVPGVGSTSYVEVEIPSQGYVCLLDDDPLPDDGDLSVHVSRAFCHSCSELWYSRVGKLIS